MNLFFPESDDSSYYIFNKYFFWNIFDYKYGYLFFDRFALSSFVKDFKELNLEYTNVSGGRGLFVDLKTVLANQVLPFLAAFYTKNSIESFSKFINFRGVYRVLNVKAGGKVLFDTLKFIIKQQKKASIF